MKKFTLLLLMFSAGQLMAQRYITRNAEVYFLSDKDAIEVVEATNNQVGAVVDLSSNDIAFQIQMRAFKFKIALMEEHFNENYVESEKYPKATFKGTFTNIPADLSKQHDLNEAGVIDFHVVQNNI